MKACPYCGKQYTDDVLVCELDQNPLVATKMTVATSSGAILKEQPKISSASFFRKLLDLIFGAFLIGVAPMSVFALFILPGEILHLFHIQVVIPIGFVITCVVYSAALLAFIGALFFRLRKRLLPRGFIVAEVVFGIVGAFFAFLFYCALIRSLID